MITDKEYFRLVVDLFGIVQAVGFRPALYQLASQAALGGWVQNRSDRVRLSIDGPPKILENFIEELPKGIPALARLDRVEILSRTKLSNDEISKTFTIIDSVAGTQAEVAIPADLGMCQDCRAEILCPENRRYGYPFTTCTQCGPRYTVINSMPYDRIRTTLSEFPLCEACLDEYENAANRRFHAESTACPTCGPHLVFTEANIQCEGPEALLKIRQRLQEGAITAIRGIGGYLIAVDARNRQALKNLRKRKQRPDKPFAVMGANLEALHEICQITPAAEKLLSSPQMPIVILELKETARKILPMDLLTPDANTMGAMLPTSPLHHLLFNPLNNDPTPSFKFLVMTSGNQGGEPICITNFEATSRLAGIADVILSHNREINLRNDDSLCIMRGNSPQVWRRARGYAPEPIHLTQPLKNNTLAMGAELKNTIAVGRNQQVVLSPHIGDLDTPEALDSLNSVVEYLPQFLDVVPQCVAVDLHPDMHSTRIGKSLAAKWQIPLVKVQHHHAHAAACMAEHNCSEALALVFDGTGLGPDGNIWGAELLHVTESSYVRRATFSPVPLPGGDAAVKQPARQLIARWILAGIDMANHDTRRLKVTETEIAIWSQQITRKLNAPLSHSAGRLFDAFSVALGIAPQKTSYDGQPAIRLEALATRAKAIVKLPEIPYRTFERGTHLEIDWQEAFIFLRDVSISDKNREIWALAIHYAIANAACEMIEFATSGSPCRTVVLSGGVFMNRILANRVTHLVRNMGLDVLEHQLVPPNDGGVSLGQAVIAGR